MTELLKKVRVINPNLKSEEIADVLIADGKVAAIAPDISDIPADSTIQDCQGLILGTGLVDLYSHCSQPGFEQRETLSSMLQAASAGGFTRITILPDTSPVVDHPAMVTQLQQTPPPHAHSRKQEGELKLHPQVYVWGAISLDLAGKQLTELADLAAAGVVGFTDGQPWDNLGFVQRVLEYLQPWGKPVAFSPGDRLLSGHGVMREGVAALRFGLPPVPASAETTALAALLELVAATATPVHIMRVSTARSVELIATAKAGGLPITASTTWMHLLLDTTAIASYNTSLRLEPPLGNPSDVEALRGGVKNGVIDAIAIDHAPYTYEEKMQAFASSPPGAMGYELALPLLWQNLVATGKFTALELWGALSTHPAECLQQQPSTITTGAKAELILFDPQETWKVEPQNLYTLSSNTPWLGKQLQGRVVKVWHR
ncbi:dihydroorotase [Anabaenopsis tanganyikae CS-531]|uniref:Dihydroorotase n=1 Tax=Anabaenopsis tanganyikae CS-531 TaxID=2785304 RepID=A0ABT6KCW9_9CYAN|nr:dihydroorotase [Anabaenopsis tanganyikae]MDH6105532.1 dihydroorotase [Anabaenopsis tanganyikae CS-531]